MFKLGDSHIIDPETDKPSLRIEIFEVEPDGPKKEGTLVTLKARPTLRPAPPPGARVTGYSWTANGALLRRTTRYDEAFPTHDVVEWDTADLRPGAYFIVATADWVLSDAPQAPSDSPPIRYEVLPRPLANKDTLRVSMRRTQRTLNPRIVHDAILKASAQALSFKNYDHFLSLVLCGDKRHEGVETFKRARHMADFEDRWLPYTDSHAYRLLKAATEAFVMVHCAVGMTQEEIAALDIADLENRLETPIGDSALEELYNLYLEKINGTEDRLLPYYRLIRDKLSDVPIIRSWFPDETHGVMDHSAEGNGAESAHDGLTKPDKCYGILREKFARPCFIELIWSYWHEEGMLVQTLNAISRRFQNIRGRDPDPLAGIEIDPLRSLNNLLWGYIQDEQHRLTLTRRNYEYDHHYGIRLVGKAVTDFRPADSRSKFIEAFHHLLALCREFYCQDDDTTVIADGFPVMNALQETHTILTEGQHNQYGDLPSTARIEMLMQQWILARPEFREFLPTRIMVALPERWMDRVDAMKHLQGWTDVSSLHFRNLANFGEQVLLSIRFGDWNNVTDANSAANWARFWRQEIQGYLHAYRAATGVDLTAERVDKSMPSQRLQERLIAQVHRR
jgi:hypothetical protein